MFSHLSKLDFFLSILGVWGKKRQIYLTGKAMLFADLLKTPERKEKETQRQGEELKL